MDTTSTTDFERAIGQLTVVPAECSVCADSGYIWNHEEHRIEGLCECHKDQQAKRLVEWKRAQTYLLKSILLPKIDLTRTEKRAWYSELPQKGGVWLSGPADKGKTHAAGWMVAKKIQEAKQPFTWSWFKAREIFKAWVDQYSDDPSERYTAKDVAYALSSHDLIVIDDLDKTGRITQAREEHLFEMFDGIYSRQAELIVPANITLTEFCSRMEGEDMFIKRDGIGPQQRRIRDICKEVKI
jgi:DNA replication protein DnaC